MVDVDKAVIARINIGGEHFEILVDSDLAIDFRQGKEVDIEDIIADTKVFLDAKAGTLASENKVNQLFGSDDYKEIAKKIITEGEIQITTEHMKKLRDEKKKQIIQIIHRNGCDPKTGLPHPVTRLETAYEDIKFNVDPFKPAELQTQDVMKLLQPILPIRFGTEKFDLKIPHKYVGATQHVVRKSASIKKESYDNEGDWIITVEVPSGLVEEFFDKLNGLTHGEMISSNDKVKAK